MADLESVMDGLLHELLDRSDISIKKVYRDFFLNMNLDENDITVRNNLNQMIHLLIVQKNGSWYKLR